MKASNLSQKGIHSKKMMLRYGYDFKEKQNYVEAATSQDDFNRKITDSVLDYTNDAYSHLIVGLGNPSK